MSRQDGGRSALADIKPRVRDFMPASALLVLTLAGMTVLSVVPGPNQHQLAVLFAPRVGLEAAAALVGAAGGELVDVSRLHNLVIATSDRPGFAQALYKAGAWLVMNPVVAHGCGASIPLGRVTG